MIRLILTTAMGGAIAGTLFSILVVGLADCTTPDCVREQAIGILRHAATGAAIGALLGALASFARRYIVHTR